VSLPDSAYFVRLDLCDFHMMSTRDRLPASAADTEQSKLGREVMDTAVELLLARQYITSGGTGDETNQVVRGSGMGCIRCESVSKYHMDFLDVRHHIVRGRVQTEPGFKEIVPIPLWISSGHPPAVRSWPAAMVRRLADVASTTSPAVAAKAELVARMRQLFADEDVVQRVESTSIVPLSSPAASPRARSASADLWLPPRFHRVL